MKKKCPQREILTAVESTSPAEQNSILTLNKMEKNMPGRLNIQIKVAAFQN